VKRFFLLLLFLLFKDLFVKFMANVCDEKQNEKLWHFIFWFNLVLTCSNQMLDLVRATVPESTTGCTTKVVNIERAAVSHFNVGGPFTTV